MHSTMAEHQTAPFSCQATAKLASSCHSGEAAGPAAVLATHLLHQGRLEEPGSPTLVQTTKSATRKQNKIKKSRMIDQKPEATFREIPSSDLQTPGEGMARGARSPRLLRRAPATPAGQGAGLGSAGHFSCPKGSCLPCHLFPPADPLPTQAGRSRLPTQERVEEVLTQSQLLFQLSPSPSQSDVAFIHSLGNSLPTLYSSPPICHLQ